MLVENGADLSAPNSDGSTALDIARKRGRQRFIWMLGGEEIRTDATAHPDWLEGRWVVLFRGGRTEGQGLWAFATDGPCPRLWSVEKRLTYPPLRVPSSSAAAGLGSEGRHGGGLKVFLIPKDYLPLPAIVN